MKEKIDWTLDKKFIYTLLIIITLIAGIVLIFNNINPKKYPKKNKTEQYNVKYV